MKITQEWWERIGEELGLEVEVGGICNSNLSFAYDDGRICEIYDGVLYHGRDDGTKDPTTFDVLCCLHLARVCSRERLLQEAGL